MTSTISTTPSNQCFNIPHRTKIRKRDPASLPGPPPAAPAAGGGVDLAVVRAMLFAVIAWGGAATVGADRPRPTEAARKSYLGRVVAPPMSHLGAAWLIRVNRDDEENVTDSYRQLNLTSGQTVCDMGCGNGFWTLPMAKDVGPDGRVLAVDIQPEMLEKLRVRAAKSEIENIDLILGTVDDPNLPEGKVDLLLMVDVYHEFSHPESMLWGIRRALKPEGTVALLEYREEDPTVPIKPLHKMSKTQIMKEYKANGFKLVREHNELPWQHLMFFARDDSPLQEIEPLPANDVLDQLK